MITSPAFDRRRAAIAAAALSAVVWVPSARAELGKDCVELGPPLVDHSCFHGRHGPYGSVLATSGSAALANTPSVDEVHTYYTVTLAPGEGASAVTYRPIDTSEYAIFTQPNVPLAVLDEAGAEVAVVLEHATPSCEHLTSARVVPLTRGRRYRVVLGPTATSVVGLVIEDAWGFPIFAGVDADRDGSGDPGDVLETPCLPPPGRAADDRDCDDGNPAVHPAVVETCDGVDENCNGVADDLGLPCDVGLGACAAGGISVCPTPGAAAVCEGPSPGDPVAEECNGADDDCDGMTDEDGAELCGGSELPVCLALGSEHRCGCTGDRQCGEAASGRICDLASYSCVDGCVDGFDRNGCPEGLRCTSRDFARPGVCSSACTGDGECRDAALPRCQLDAGVCVECVSDGDCAGRSDGRSACDVAVGQCARPTADGGGCSTVAPSTPGTSAASGRPPPQRRIPLWLLALLVAAAHRLFGARHPRRI